jgi:urease beta subunit
MIPGEIFSSRKIIPLNEGNDVIEILVKNFGDRIVFIGSHMHFMETNSSLSFDRQSAKNRRLDIPAGTMMVFEPGEEKTVSLVRYGGMGMPLSKL